MDHPVAYGRDAQPAIFAAALGIITSRTASGLNLRALRSSRSSDRKPCSPTTVVMWRAVCPSTPAERAPHPPLATRAQASTRTAGS